MCVFVFFFFFNDTATTEIYTLSLQRRSSDLDFRLLAVDRAEFDGDFESVLRTVAAPVSGHGLHRAKYAGPAGLRRLNFHVCPGARPCPAPRGISRSSLAQQDASDKSGARAPFVLAAAGRGDTAALRAEQISRHSTSAANIL